VAVATGNARGEASKASNMISRYAHSFICALPRSYSLKKDL
jgi:hypothetical protein